MKNTRLTNQDVASEWKWLNWQLTQIIIKREVSEIQKLLPDKYYAIKLQLGRPAQQYFLNHYDGAISITLDSLQTSSCIINTDNSNVYVYSDYHQLPFGRRSVELIVMPHTLDLSHRPIQVLREVSQVIDDDGTLVLTGFNPASLIGMSRLLSTKLKRKTKLPSNHTPGRVKEWLQLIGFEVYSSCYIDYLPPISHPRIRRMLGFLDKAGDRWWPVFAGVYIIIARKEHWKPEKVSMFATIRKHLNPKVVQPTTCQRD